MKKCNKCLLEKTLDNFFKDKNSIDGHYSICKECKTKRTLAWRAKNKDTYNRKMREYQAEHILDIEESLIAAIEYLNKSCK